MLYLVTMAPTVLWGDDAELQRIVVTGEPRIVGQSSSASHLLWLTLARWFVPATAWLPLDPAGRSTLLTALFAAVALVAVFFAAAELARPFARRSALAGFAAAAALGLSHTFWLLAVRPDVYTLQTALLAIATWAVLRWRATVKPGWLLVAGAAVVAALANHAMILVSLPGLALLALALPDTAARRRVWFAAAVVVALALAGVAVLAATLPPAAELLRTLARFRPVIPRLRDVALVPLYLLYQFPLAWALAAAGTWALWRRDRWLATGLAVLYAANAALPLALRVADRFLFFLPSYVPVALAVGAGAVFARDRWLAHGVGTPDTSVGGPPARSRRQNPVQGSTFSRSTGTLVQGQRTLGAHLAVRLGPVLAAMLGAPLIVYPLAAVAGGALAARLAPARHLPGRDPVAFYLWPPKTGYVGARRFGEAVLTGLAPQAAVLADWLPYQTLRYLQTVEGRRRDVLLVNLNAGTGEQLRFLLDQDGRRPLYLADASPPPYYDVADIERCFAIDRTTVVYRLTRRLTASCS